MNPTATRKRWKAERPNYDPRYDSTEQDTAMNRFDYDFDDEYTIRTPRPTRTAAYLAAQAEANRVDRLRRELERAELNLIARKRKEVRLADAIARFGDDHYADGNVIMFNKTFSTNRAKVYQYAAIRAKGLWYTTGPKSPKAYTWSELVAWMVGSDPDEPGVNDVWVVTEITSTVDGYPIRRGFRP